MPLTTRSPVRLASEPSSGPYEIMAASQQAHIDELVQKNRTGEHTIKKLQHSLEEEKERANDVVKRLKAASADERKEWREGCDSLLGCHRIVHLRTIVELEKERMNVLKEREETRKERLAVLQRDFKLTLFLAKEAEFETYTARLKEQLEELNAEKEASEADLIASHDQELLVLRGDLSRAEATKKEKSDELKRVQKEMDTLRAEISSLREAKTTTKATNETLSTKLERAQLQLDGAKTTQAELETKNSELKRTNADLKRQLDKWQSLETKGGMEMEELRKRCITLEVQEKELADRVKDLEKALESERRKVAKLRDQNEKLSEVAEEAQEHATEKQNEADAAIAELAKAQKAVETLKAKLQTDAEKSTTFKKPKPPSPRPPSSDDEPAEIPGSEREVEMAVTPVAPSKPRPRPRPAYKNAEPPVESGDVEDLPSKKAGKRKATTEVDEGTAASRKRKKAPEDDEVVMIEPPAKSNLKGKSKAKEDSDDEIVDVTPQKKSKKDLPERKETKPSKKKKDEKEATPEEEEETEVEERRRKDKGKGKAKVKAEDDSDVEELPVPKAKPRSRSAKPASQADSKKAKVKQPAEEEVETVEDDPQPKKKKKRIFTNSQPTTFDWSSMPPQADGGLNIPTELSPVKETDAVPARSMFGKLLGFR
ncbi:hypothetical protein BD410DRAFT_819894 [Rickenella mellea]|uniref:Uncharacterized protein n=1 Tax=Rickenella mellea TaxID=50990 RepID=A0A4Y7QF48_9AGAM|nr:hypothetical protein BD410DRAFT_819894 [Rickenella mellea]